MYTVVRGNVLGAVIAPRGTENFSKDERQSVWRTLVRPLVGEVAEHEVLPMEDVMAVTQQLLEFCLEQDSAVGPHTGTKPVK